MALLTSVGVGIPVCHLLLAVLVAWNRRRTPSLADAESAPAADSAWPTVIALVPARNEEANIGACVRSLLAQDYPNLQVRVIDDHSTDRTAAIVESLRVKDPRLSLMSAPD